MSQTHAYSSPDGLDWTQHDKVDWGERISQAYAFFNGRLWMFGGLDYKTRKPRNDVWSSSDGVEWRSEGAAPWPARKGAAVAVFQPFHGSSSVPGRSRSMYALYP